MSEKRCYSVGDIREILGISKTTAYSLIKENQFRTIMVGGKYLISKKSFDTWLDGDKEEPETVHDKGRQAAAQKGVETDEERKLSYSIHFGHHAR